MKLKSIHLIVLFFTLVTVCLVILLFLLKTDSSNLKITQKDETYPLSYTPVSYSENNQFVFEAKILRPKLIETATDEYINFQIDLDKSYRIENRDNFLKITSDSIVFYMESSIGEGGGIFNDHPDIESFSTSLLGEVYRLKVTQSKDLKFIMDSTTKEFKNYYYYSNYMQFTGCFEGATYCGVSEITIYKPVAQSFIVYCAALNASDGSKCDNILKSISIK